MNHAHRAFSLALLAAMAVAACLSPVKAAEDPLLNLRASHPRLMVLDDQIKAVLAVIRTDPLAARTFASLKRDAEKLMTQPPVQHVLIGPRMLAQSRQALYVISTMGGLYRLTGETRYAERAKKEMLAVAAFADWNPSHFLDVAEMTNACGIGYDWIYDQLTAAERAVISNAIVEKGLKPGLEQYSKHAFWTDCNFNWAQVCAGGLTVGALAIADEQPEKAGKILDLARITIKKPMEQFAPDGGWDEGPGYWNYATTYNVFYLSAIQSALGTDFGLNAQPGFSDTGSFHIQLTGPSRKLFNFADAGDGLEPAWQMFWLARTFHNPADAAWERSVSDGHMGIFHLLWFNTDGKSPASFESLPLDSLFKRTNIGVFRGSWTDPNAWYVAFKGGDNAASHSHLDLGTFVLDALGQRWGVQLGPDNYNLPGYFGKQRFTYYRLRTEGQNTLTFDNGNQPVKARASVTAFHSTPDKSMAIIDLSQAYPVSVLRGICMLHRHQVLIQDEVDVDAAKEQGFEWHFHTPAKVEIAGNTATLSLGGAKLRATLLSPVEGTFAALPCDVPPPQKPNPGISDLIVRCGTSTRTIAVLFSAIDDHELPMLKPLKDWAVK